MWHTRMYSLRTQWAYIVWVCATTLVAYGTNTCRTDALHAAKQPFAFILTRGQRGKNKHVQLLGPKAKPIDNEPINTLDDLHYDFTKVERKWREIWDNSEAYGASSWETSKKKFYALGMFPYPSGTGLHVGHCKIYTATDVISRMKRMQGYNVLHPMGWDAFGLPAEQFSKQTNTLPTVSTLENIKNFKYQLKRMGYLYDWKRELSTTETRYYKWTQWIFLQLFKKKLAYQSMWPALWCPALGTVLANEEVINGKSERGNHPVYYRPMKQWLLNITAYADRLLDDLNLLTDWPDNIKAMQRNWIGKSDGIEIRFEVVNDHLQEVVHDLPFALNYVELERILLEANGTSKYIWGFSKNLTYLDGCEYLAVSPEAIYSILKDGNEPSSMIEPNLLNYTRSIHETDHSKAQYTENKNSVFKCTENAMSGCFTGLYAIHPIEKKVLPIVVAEYMLDGGGETVSIGNTKLSKRDKNFVIFNSKMFNSFANTRMQLNERINKEPNPPMYEGMENCSSLPPISIQSHEMEPSDGTTAAMSLGGNSTERDKNSVINDLKAKQLIRPKSVYKLRDWVFSRQRYWGEPFPIVFDETNGKAIALNESDLPVELPRMDEVDSKMNNASCETPLGRYSSWLNVKLDNGINVVREANTMPQWAGSNWYFLRFIDPNNSQEICDKRLSDWWMPVDVYVGGSEHATLHLLYSRFIHKFLYDLGVVSTPEPFKKLVVPGMMLGTQPTHYVLVMNEAKAEYAGVPVKEVIFTQHGKPLRSVLSELDETVEGKRDVEVGYHKLNGTPVHARPLSTVFDFTEESIMRKGNKCFLLAEKAFVLDNSMLVVEPNGLIELITVSQKMSKSKGNTVNPESIAKKWGTDALRLHVCFLGPLEKVNAWNFNGLEGTSRFISRVWKIFANTQKKYSTLTLHSGKQCKEVSGATVTRDVGYPHINLDTHPSNVQLNRMNYLIKRVTKAIESYSFNVAIAALMEYLNELYKWPDGIPVEVMKTFTKLLYPFCPHLAEEAWEVMHTNLTGDTQTTNSKSLYVGLTRWPSTEDTPDGRLKGTAVNEGAAVMIHVNGAKRGKILIRETEANDIEKLLERAKVVPNVRRVISKLLSEGKSLKRASYIPPKTISFVLA